MDPKSTRSSRSRLTTLGALVFVLLVSLFGALEYSQVSSLQSQNRTLSSSVVSYSSELKTFTHYQTKLEAANAQQLEDTCAGEGCDLIQGSNSSALSQAWLLHLAKLEEFDIQGAVEDYAPNATMIWVGDTQGLGGTYNGSNLEFALQVFPGGSNSFSLAIQSFNSTTLPNGTAIIAALLAFTGSSNVDGSFHGTISASYQYISQNGIWLISQERWNFQSFTVQYAGGFP